MKVVFVDESPMALDSSRLNVETNMSESFNRCEFMINNALSGMEPFRFNTVFCNPPFPIISLEICSITPAAI